jgi:hypothetical protein
MCKQSHSPPVVEETKKEDSQLQMHTDNPFLMYMKKR